MLDFVTMHLTYANLTRVMVRPSMSGLSTRLMACLLLFHLVNRRLLFYDHFIILCLFIITGPGAITYATLIHNTVYVFIWHLVCVNCIIIFQWEKPDWVVEENGRRQPFQCQILSANGGGVRVTRYRFL